MSALSILLTILVLLGNNASRAQSAAATHPVAIIYTESPYADYLFYLLYRSTGSFPELKTSVPLDDIAPLQEGSFLPDEVAAADVNSYAELYKRASTYDAHVRLIEMLKKGEPRYSAFLSFWQTHIGPKEDETIDAWRKQDARWPPVAHLEDFERLKFPFSNLKIAMLALDPQGSSMQGPPTIFTTVQVPSLAWAIGHEGTHMMLGPKGADWKKRKNADQAIQLMTAKGGSDYDVEEALCLLMQAKLSIAAGATRNDYVSSEDFTEVSPRRTLLLALESDWPAYLNSPHTNIADFLIAETMKTFSHH